MPTLSPLRRSRVIFVAALTVAALPGCLVGGGDGWVTGDVSLAQCREDKPLDKKGDFDLQVSFFAGESMQDPNPAPAQRRSRLTVRLQNASTTIEVSDGLMFQFRDTARAAQYFAAGQALPVTERSLCAGSCPLAEDLVRARLYLYTTCPKSRQGLIATNRGFSQQASGTDGQSCQVPASEESSSACSSLAAGAAGSLETLCQGDFNKRDSADLLRSTLGQGGSSCLYLCQFGPVRRGQDKESLTGFSIDYGAMVAGLFSLHVVDGRSISSAGCAEGVGQVQGMFKFKVTRGLAAQNFP